MSEPLVRFQPVSKRNPCKVCGKPDWCLISKDGGTAICQRVESDRKVGDKDAGWSHKIADVPRPLGPLRPPPPEDMSPRFNVPAVMHKFREAMSEHRVVAQAESMGIDPAGLEMLGTGYDADRNALAFPMKDGAGELVGIRLRHCHTGEKWAYPDSRNGLFYSDCLLGIGPVYIVEGPTDTAAMLGLGLEGDVIGRPFSHGGVLYLRQLLGDRIDRTIVIIHDNDPVNLKTGKRAGLQGAVNLAREFPKHSVKLMVCPGGWKDPRAWISKGKATASTIAWAAKNVKTWRSN